MLGLCLLLYTIFNEEAYLTFKSIFHNALKYMFCYLRKSQFPCSCLVFNKEGTGTILIVFAMTRSWSGIENGTSSSQWFQEHQHAHVMENQSKQKHSIIHNHSFNKLFTLFTRNLVKKVDVSFSQMTTLLKHVIGIFSVYKRRAHKYVH